MRRMTSSFDPKHPHFNDLWPIHTERSDGCLTDFGESDDHSSIHRPSKMIEPDVLLGMKQNGITTGVRCSVNTV